MGTIAAAALIERAATLIYDDTHTHWPEDELRGWLNDGQRQIVLLKPEAYTRNEVVQLVAGTRQTLPGTGVTFSRVVRNMGADGATPGRAVRWVEMADLDREHPDWHVEAAKATVVHYMYDDRDPKRFYVTPPQPPGAQYVEIVYSAAPPEVASGAAIALDDIYANALLDYILYRARTKDSKRRDPAGASAAYGIFLNALGMKEQAERYYERPRSADAVAMG